MTDGAYQQTQFHRAEVDNPDQGIAEDIRDFAASALSLSLSLLSAIATLASFGGLPWTLSGEWAVPVAAHQLRVPGFLLGRGHLCCSLDMVDARHRRPAMVWTSR